MNAHQELILQKKGRTRRLTANAGTAADVIVHRDLSLDADTEAAFLESMDLIKDLLNIEVSQMVLARAAIQALHIKLLNLLDEEERVGTEEDKQVHLSKLFLLRGLLYKAAHQRFGK